MDGKNGVESYRETVVRRPRETCCRTAWVWRGRASWTARRLRSTHFESARSVVPDERADRRTGGQTLDAEAVPASPFLCFSNPVRSSRVASRRVLRCLIGGAVAVADCSQNRGPPDAIHQPWPWPPSLPPVDENELGGGGGGGGGGSVRIESSRMRASNRSVGEMGDRFRRNMMVLLRRWLSRSCGTRSRRTGCREAACSTRRLPNCLFGTTNMCKKKET